MPEMMIPIVGPLQKGVSPRLNSQRCVNWIPQMEGEGAKYPTSLRHTPGMKRWVAAGRSPCRGATEFQGDQIWVFNDEVVKIDSRGNRTLLGTLETDGGMVSIAANHIELCIVDGSNNLYSYVPSDASPFVTKPFTDFGGVTDNTNVNPTHIAMKDFRFIINRTGNATYNGYFLISELNNGRSYSGATTNAESAADPILAVGATSNDIALFGSRTIQFYYNSGDPDFPFEPNRGRDLTWGIGAPLSLAQANDTFFGLMKTKEGGPVAMMLPGGVISSPDLAAAMRKMQRTDDAIGFCYEQDQHLFYHLTFPTGDATWVYDVSTQLWHERESWGYGRHLARATLFFGNKLYVGREDTGYIYEWDIDTWTDDGVRIRRERRAPVIHANHRTLFVHEVEIEVEGGVGLTGGDEPLLELDYSVDGGRNFINTSTAGVGELGEYQRGARFHSLGSGREFIFRLQTTEPVPWTVLAARMRFDGSDHAI